MNIIRFILITAAVASGLCVTEIRDGDTFVLSDGSVVELSGIDAPEMAAYSKAYRDARECRIPVTRMIEVGKLSAKYAEMSYLYQDVLRAIDSVARDGKIYVTLLFKRDSVQINRDMVESGYAKAMVSIKKKGFIRAETLAMRKLRGLWRTHPEIMTRFCMF